MVSERTAWIVHYDEHFRLIFEEGAHWSFGNRIILNSIEES